MMANPSDSCAAKVSAATGGKLSESDAGKLVQNLQQRYSPGGILDIDALMASSEAALSSAKTLLEAGPLNRVRQEALQLKKRNSLAQVIESLVDGGASPVDVVADIIRGRNDLTPGGRFSVGLYAQAQESKRLSDIARVLEKHDLKPALADPEQASELSLEILNAFSEGYAPETPMQRAALEFVETILEPERIRLNKAGGYVTKSPHLWFNESSGNSEAILRGGKEQFINLVGQVNLSKDVMTFNKVKIAKALGKDPESITDREYLSRVYDKLTRTADTELSPDAPTQAELKSSAYSPVFSNYADNLSAAAWLPFADAQSYKTFASAYGGNDLFGALSRRIQRTSRLRAVVEKMGPRPFETLKRLQEHVTARYGSDSRAADLLSNLSEKDYLKEERRLLKQEYEAKRRLSPQDSEKTFEEYYNNLSPEKRAKLASNALRGELASQIVSGRALAGRGLLNYDAARGGWRGDGEALSRVLGTQTPEALLGGLTGELYKGSGSSLARTFKLIRLVESAGKLGGVVLSQLSDLSTQISNMSRYYGGGGNVLVAAFKQVGMFEAATRHPILRKVLRKGSNFTPEETEFLSRLGSMGSALQMSFADTVFTDLGGDMYGITHSPVERRLEQANKLLASWGGVEAWSLTQQKFASYLAAQELAKENLNEPTLKWLNSYGISAEDIKSATYIDDTGKRWVMPDLAPTEDLQDRIQAALYDSVMDSVNLPDFRTQVARTAGLQRGSLPGEIAYAVTFLKSFAINTAIRTVPRIQAEGGTAALAAWLTFATGLGLLSTQLKYFASGNTPPNYEEHPEKLVYDILGSSPISAMMFGFYDPARVASARDGAKEAALGLVGPIVGSGVNILMAAGQGIDLAVETASGKEPDPAQLAKTGGRLFKNYLPGALSVAGLPAAPAILGNPATKGLLNHFVFDAMMEGVTPGYAEAKRETLYRDTGQESLFN